MTAHTRQTLRNFYDAGSNQRQQLLTVIPSEIDHFKKLQRARLERIQKQIGQIPQKNGPLYQAYKSRFDELIEGETETPSIFSLKDKLELALVAKHEKLKALREKEQLHTNLYHKKKSELLI